jgi:hypothetical protein
VTTHVAARLVGATLLISFAVAPRGTAAQSTGASAAWAALTLSPVGAMTPLARAPGELAAGGSDISMRYGRWRYDPDDAVHDTFGLTYARGLPFRKTRLEITGAYSLVECPTCAGSVIGGIDLESRIWEHGLPDAEHNPVRSGVSVRLSLGGAKSLGADHSVAGSTAITLPLDVAFPLGRKVLLGASVQPGFGYGHIGGTEFGAGGVLPLYGASVSLHAGSRVGLHVGMERVVIDGGPTLIGAAFSWRLR